MDKLIEISDNDKIKKKIERLTGYDQLTGLLLRSRFMDQLRSSLLEAESHKWKLVVFYIDIDNQKIINDTYGHDKGDIYIKKVARKLQSCIKKKDAVCRMGGDEFAMFVTGFTSRSGINEYMDYLLETLYQPIDIKGYRIYGSVSIGIAIYPKNGCEEKLLVTSADIAMNRAKELGKNRLQYFDNSMMKTALITNEMKINVKRLHQQDGFYLCYQPIYDIRQRRVATAEALICWEHPVMGLVSPSDFIPLAEKTRFIIPLGKWMLENACSQIMKWHGMNIDIALSVNISAVQLCQTDFAAMVKSILLKHRLEPEYLMIEIRPSEFWGNNETVINNIRTLSSLGVKLSIDDFGSGYNSFLCIQEELFGSLKIDRNFVSCMKNEMNKAIIDTIIQFGKKMKMTITAEGIESMEQYEYLEKAGCDYLQGNFISKPLLPEEFEYQTMSAKYTLISG